MTEQFDEYTYTPEHLLEQKEEPIFNYDGDNSDD